MPYRLQHDEALSSGLQRIAEEQINAAITHLQAGLNVHQARKGLKKARAVLNLLKPQLGPLCVEENHRLRDVARRFGALRDADVSVEVLEKFANHYKRKSTLNPHRQALSERKAALNRQTDWKAQLNQALDALTGTRKRMEDWHLRDVTQGSLDAQIRKTHKKSRHALSRAAQSCTAEDFHELRKAVKREVNQLSIFETPEPLIRDLKQLSSLLGEHHDLSVFTATLENTSSRFRQIARRQQKVYEAQILPLASLIYARHQTSMQLSSSSHIRSTETPRIPLPESPLPS